jgi:hypothetical protein
VVALMLLSVLTATACDAIGGGGPKKVVVNDRVCASVTFLRMTAGETHRVVLDVNGGVEGTQSMSFRLDQVPMNIVGDVPPNSTIGEQFSTVTLTAEEGDEASVDIVPTRAGNYKAVCGIVTGGRIVARDISIQVLEG